MDTIVPQVRHRPSVGLWGGMLLAAMSSAPVHASLAQGNAREPLPTVTAFVDVTVIPMDSERVVPGQTVLVRGNRIAAIGPRGKLAVPRGALRIEGGGKFLIPGLADMHTHVALNDVDSAEAERLLLRKLAQGVTTIRNMDFETIPQEWIDRFRRQRARAAVGEILSPRIYTSGPWNGPTKGGSPADVARALAAYKAQGYDFVKIHEDERGNVVTTELYDSLVAAAHRLGLPVVGHLPRKQGAYEATITLERALQDYTSIEHLQGYPQPVYDALTEHQKATFLETLDTMALPAATALGVATKRAGVWICPTQFFVERTNHGFMISSGGERMDFLRLFGFHTERKTVFHRRIIKALQDAGVGLLLGTDEIKGQLDVTTSDELGALVRAGLTPYQAIVTGTRNVADYFGTRDETGTIAAGKRADLVLLEGNPLTDVQHTARPVGVMIGGRWLTRQELESRLAGVAQSRRE